ncbi:MAG: SMC-Scp complex subunit ScpB [Armatimonadetes bacterium]|nr:SMC-Scp complex subunit ScpB [Armatimonadota bacterium]
MRLIEKVQALLFVADSPATPEELADALEMPIYEIEEALEKLGAKLTHEGALQIVRIAGGYQICTKPEAAEYVARFLKPQKQKLSRSMMEVLAIIAYKQPTTIAEIDEVRGMQSDYGLRSLIDRRLIAEVGRKSTPGRPVLYGTTQQFLHLFNLEKIEDLPTVELNVNAVGADVVPEQPALIDSAEEPQPDLIDSAEEPQPADPAAV